MANGIRLFYGACVFIYIIHGVLSGYDQDVFSNILTFLDGLKQFRSTTRPVQNVSDVLDIKASWNLVSVIDFDETSGFIEVSGYLTLSWKPTAYADILTADFNASENTQNTDMWKPSILLVNSLKYYDEVGSDTKIRIEYDFTTQTCTWKPWMITKVACSPNVQYYPFDKQSCALRFSIWGYKSSEVKLKPTSSDWMFAFFEENGEWVVSNTTVESFDVDGVSTIDFKIDLTRRPLYYIINLLAPVVLLGVLNSFTFLLPIASGERIGFSVTCFLAYVVLLNTIMLYLPTSSTPFSNLSYYTFIMMLFSAGVCLTTIFTIRIHHKDEGSQVPKCVASLFRCLMCKCFGQKEKKRPRSDTGTIGDAVTSNEDETWEVTWAEIASFFDTLLFLGFFGGQAFFSVGYLLPLFFISDSE